VVGELGEASPADVAAKLGRDTQTTANLMGTLLRRGELRRVRRGVYALARRRPAA
jgi:predicted transcriptional regulator of viral defense system